jgi:hypothetical protein
MRPTTYRSASRRPAWISGFTRIDRVITTGVALAIIATTAACSDDDTATGPGNGPVTGAFAMKTARGFAVPHTFTDAAGKKLTVEGGGLTMSPGGTFALNYKGKLQALEFDLTEEGTVAVAGSNITFTPDDGDPPFTGRIQGKTITVKFRIAGASFDLGFTGN